MRSPSPKERKKIKRSIFFKLKKNEKNKMRFLIILMMIMMTMVIRRTLKKTNLKFIRALLQIVDDLS